MTKLFDVKPKRLDKNFKILCDDPRLEKERAFVEDLWKQYEGFGDRDFPIRIAQEFHRHFWEMYLTCALMQIGLKPLPKIKRKGPDICLQEEKTLTWVEAIAPGPGTTKDGVPSLKVGVPSMIPENNVILRFTSAFSEKYKKYERYLKDGIISKNEPYIIAVNGGEIPYSSIADDGVPRIVKAAFAIGPYAKTINMETLETVSEGLTYRPEILKRSDAQVPINFFLDKGHQGISGLLFSNVTISSEPKRLGSDFILIHNPFAINKAIPDGWLKVGREYWYRIESNELVEKVW